MAEPVYLEDVVVKAVTDKALLIEYEGEEEWIPKSQIVEDESVVHEKGDKGTLAITQWIASQKGWD
jgi:hypothetical protein